MNKKQKKAKSFFGKNNKSSINLKKFRKILTEK